jgi:hypothetical protein
MALIAYLVSLNREFSSSVIRIFRIIDRDTDRAEAFKRLEELSKQARIEAQVNVIPSEEPPASLIRNNSVGHADVVLLGMSARNVSEFRRYIETMEPLLADLPTTVLVHSNGEADVFA